jgi:phosphate transport system permease protein
MADVHTQTAASSAGGARSSFHASDFAVARLKKRYGKEIRFRWWGRAAIGVALAALIWLLTSLVGTGYTAFRQHFMTLEVTLTESVIDPSGARDRETLRGANFRKIIQETMYAQYPEVSGRTDKRALFGLISASGATNQVRQMVYQNPDLIGQTVTLTFPASDQVDQLLKGYIDRNVEESRRKISDQQIKWIDEMKANALSNPNSIRSFLLIPIAAILNWPESQAPSRAL